MEENKSTEWYEDHIELMRLYVGCSDVLVRRFMDLNNGDLKVKIKVLKLIEAGKMPSEIKDYWKILDNYPSKDARWS